MAQKPISTGLKNVIVARVNGTPISEYQLAAGLEQLLEPYKDTKGKVRLNQQEQYSARKQVLDNLILRELLYQEAVRRRLEVSKAEFEQVVKEATAEYRNEQHLNAMLVMQGLSPEEYFDQIRRDILINKIAASLVEGKRKTLTTADARAYYDTHIEEMQGPEVRRVLLMEVPLDRYAEAPAEAAARAKLEPFTTSAQSFQDAFLPGKAPTGVTLHDLGHIQRKQFHPLLDSVAFRTAEGTVSRIIRTEEGLHLLLVTNILKAGQTWPFELIEEDLKKKLYEKNSVSIVNAFVDGLRKKAAIDIHDTIADNKLGQEKQ
jgi:peptidyl-prolyl cis-trans isomerase C